MTKKIDNSGKAKQRMREYLRSVGVDFSTAEKMCGFKRGFLSAGGVVGSDKLSMFIESFPEADLYHIVTGKPDKTRERMLGTLQNIAAEIIDILPSPGK